jgi:tRNA threonylcarbamoyladenosine biosynthesis protein TsaE
MNKREMFCQTADETFRLGEELGRDLEAGDVVLLYGGLGAGKTLLTKGIVNALDFDIDEVTSPSFTLVNLYKTPRLAVYHIDLWRLDGGGDPAEAIGLGELMEEENAALIIEWADRLLEHNFPHATTSIHIEGDGDEPRKITIEQNRKGAAA